MPHLWLILFYVLQHPSNHPLPDNVYAAVVERVDAGRSIVMVTVLKASGSTPRKAGTRAIVDTDGAMWGTIGGGLLEARAREAALDSIASGRPVVFDFPFAGASARGDDPVCGGAMRVLVDPTAAHQREAYAAAVDALRRRDRGWLVTRVTGDGPATVSASFHEGGQAPLVDGADGIVEQVVPAPLLLVAGGGHVGQALARQASLAGFDVVVVEDRDAFAEPSRYPPGVEVRRGRFAELVGQWPLNRDTYVAIVGRGHKVDADALAAVIHGEAGYVGMMGSRRKVALVRREFVASGLATGAQFDSVHAPIGLDVGAETVPEIAAAIVAELIAVRRGRGRGPAARGR